MKPYATRFFQRFCKPHHRRKFDAILILSLQFTLFPVNLIFWMCNFFKSKRFLLNKERRFLISKKPLCKMKSFCVQKQNKWHLIRGYKTRSQAGQTLHSNYFRPPFAISLLFQCWLIGVLVQHKLKYGLDKNSSIQKKVTTTKNLAFNITSIMV